MNPPIFSAFPNTLQVLASCLMCQLQRLCCHPFWGTKLYKPAGRQQLYHKIIKIGQHLLKHSATMLNSLDQKAEESIQQSQLHRKYIIINKTAQDQRHTVLGANDWLHYRSYKRINWVFSSFIYSHISLEYSVQHDWGPACCFTKVISTQHDLHHRKPEL